jgi:hypothetical protein
MTLNSRAPSSEREIHQGIEQRRAWRPYVRRVEKSWEAARDRNETPA